MHPERRHMLQYSNGFPASEICSLGSGSGGKSTLLFHARQDERLQKYTPQAPWTVVSPEYTQTPNRPSTPFLA